MRRMTRGSYGLAKLWEKRDRLPMLSTWGKRWQLFLQALRGIKTSPFTSVLTIATIAASLVMLGLSILFIQNFGSAIGQSADALKVSVYLKDESTEAQRESLTKFLYAKQGVKKVEFRSKAEALKEFRKSLGEHGELLDGLAHDNPLPASLEASMDESLSQPPLLQELAATLKTQAGVEEVRLNEATLVEVAKVLSFLRTFSFVAIVLILLITGFIISNTIKLGLYVYHDEITIMRLVGASPGYIRAPFLIEGGIKGCVGAILSLAIVYGIYLAFIRSVEGLSLFQLLLPAMRFPGILAMTIVILVGIAVGVSGSSLAVRGGLDEKE